MQEGTPRLLQVREYTRVYSKAYNTDIGSAWKLEPTHLTGRQWKIPSFACVRPKINQKWVPTSKRCLGLCWMLCYKLWHLFLKKLVN
jgi:hypothetical protein